MNNHQLNKLADASFLAALGLCDADQIAVIFGELNKEDILPWLHFLHAAGDVPGESLYRWSAAQGLHPLPADGWSKVSADVRLFFDAFTATVKALAPLLDPPVRDKAAETRVEVAANPDPEGFMAPAYERYERGDASAYANAPGPKSTGDVFVSRPNEERLPGALAAVAQPDASPAQLSAPSTQHDPATMSVDDALEARRAAFRAADAGDVGKIISAPAPPAPEIGAVEPVAVADVVNGEQIAGTVAVANPPARKK